jgi:hypothetical protein
MAAGHRGHLLVMIAGRAHVLNEYLEKENGPGELPGFRGFSGHIRADATSDFNLLFADEEELVGCWYHCRRRLGSRSRTEQ